MTRIMQAIPAPPELYGVWVFDDGDTGVERVICLAVIDDGDDIVPIFIEGGGLTWYSGPDGPWRLYDYKPSGGELEELAKVVTAIRERERERQEARRKSQ